MSFDRFLFFQKTNFLYLFFENYQLLLQVECSLLASPLALKINLDKLFVYQTLTINNKLDSLVLFGDT